jgi:acyl-[acyl-carrier-protein] desaturase
VQVVGGQVPVVESTLDGFVYVTLQELATRIAHLKTAQRLKESVTALSPERYAIAAQAGYACLQRIAVDENYHHLLYRDLVAAAMERDPSSVMLAVKKRVEDFEMPGTGIPGFKEHAKIIAKAGIYNPAIHYEKILLPVLTRQWKVQDLSGLTPQAAEAQEFVMTRLERLGKIAARMASREPALETA